MLQQIKFHNFTAFGKLTVPLSPGINVFIGENGTGKTHVLKAGYAACATGECQGDFAQKVCDVFYPSGKNIGRLVRRFAGCERGALEVTRRLNGACAKLRLALSARSGAPGKARVSGAAAAWKAQPWQAVYIPAKDMLANAPGFVALHGAREIHFEDVHVDLVRKASLPSLRKQPDSARRKLLKRLQAVINGTVIQKNDEFFLKNGRGSLEFTLLAEGHRKLGLLWRLIENGCLGAGAVLFWDEPESNMNPKLLQMLAGALLTLQRAGVQILLSTHDYVLLKEFDLQAGDGDQLQFHSLYRNDDDEIEIASTDDYLRIAPNAIDAAFGTLIDREIGRAMEGARK